MTRGLCHFKPKSNGRAETLARLMSRTESAIFTIAGSAVSASLTGLVGCHVLQDLDLLPNLLVNLIDKVDHGDDFMRVHIDMPQGHVYVLGRDQQGEWSIVAEGKLERHAPRAAAPRWINLGESTILIGSLDALLDALRKDQYSIDLAQYNNQFRPVLARYRGKFT